MNLKISFTYYDMNEEDVKTLCYFENDKLFLSNIVNIKHIDFFKDYLPDFTEIVYFEDKKT